MEVWLLWDRVERFHIAKRKEYEAQKQWEIVQLLTQSRAISFAFQANTEVPPTKAEAERQKKGRPPNWGEIEKTRRSILEFQKRHMEGHESPYAFEAYMGLPHFFPPPPKAEDGHDGVESMKERIVARLQAVVDAGQGEASFGDLAQAANE